jgi:DNA polymerase
MRSQNLPKAPDLAELLEAVTALKGRFLYLQEMGIKALPFKIGKAPAGVDQKQMALQGIQEKMGDCRRCKLHTHRTHIVFGTGNPMAKLVFVGEAPGEDEDLQAEPFVGKAGQLLNKMIRAMGLKREQVYITNIVKCRPPNNRNPEPDEISSCEPFLIEQLGVIKPLVICALGNFAAQTLLRTRVKISQLRGKFHDYEGIRVMPTFHPAYLLRNPQDKKLVWEDLQKIMAELHKVQHPLTTGPSL